MSEAQNCHDFIEERWDTHFCVQIYILCQLLLFEFITEGMKSNKKLTHKLDMNLGVRKHIIKGCMKNTLIEHVQAH